jgi:hypothetical protein
MATASFASIFTTTLNVNGLNVNGLPVASGAAEQSQLTSAVAADMDGTGILVTSPEADNSMVLVVPLNDGEIAPPFQTMIARGLDGGSILITELSGTAGAVWPPAESHSFAVYVIAPGKTASNPIVVTLTTPGDA